MKANFVFAALVEICKYFFLVLRHSLAPGSVGTFQDSDAGTGRHVRSPRVNYAPTLATRACAKFPAVPIRARQIFEKISPGL
jgi:hypothetical protein